MSDALIDVLKRTKDELSKFASAARNASCGLNATLKAAREGVAEQLDDRAAQCSIWLSSAERRPFDAEREASIRSACAEWMRMIGA